MMGKRCICESCKKKCKKQAIKLVGDVFYHRECFLCKVCHQRLSLELFYKKGHNLYCDQDYHKQYGTWCASCKQLIHENAIIAQEKTYHTECFKCSKCRKTIAPGEMAHVASAKLLCSGCYVKGFESKRSNGELDGSGNEPKLVQKNSQKDESNSGREADLKLNTNETFTKNDEVGTPHMVLDGSVGYVSHGSNSPPDSGKKDLSPKNKSPLGVPQNTFYNFSYLERTGVGSFKRGPLSTPTPKRITHFHRPSNEFSYKDARDDIFNEIRRSRDGKECSSPIHVRSSLESDWIGPPDVAAAYPELLREKVGDSSINPVIKDEKVNLKADKEISELEKLFDSSGAAHALLKGRMEGSPDRVDPRDSSRDPAAENCLRAKLKHEHPLIASPSRFVRNERPASQRGFWPPSPSGLSPKFYSLRPGRTLYEGDILENWMPTIANKSLEHQNNLAAENETREKHVVQLSKSAALPNETPSNLNCISSPQDSTSPVPLKRLASLELQKRQ